MAFLTQLARSSTERKPFLVMTSYPLIGYVLTPVVNVDGSATVVPSNGSNAPPIIVPASVAAGIAPNLIAQESHKDSEDTNDSPVPQPVQPLSSGLDLSSPAISIDSVPPTPMTPMTPMTPSIPPVKRCTSSAKGKVKKVVGLSKNDGYKIDLEGNPKKWKNVTGLVQKHQGFSPKEAKLSPDFAKGQEDAGSFLFLNLRQPYAWKRRSK